jgi:hypothetical protein
VTGNSAPANFFAPWSACLGDISTTLSHGAMRPNLSVQQVEQLISRQQRILGEHLQQGKGQREDYAELRLKALDLKAPGVEPLRSSERTYWSLLEFAR